MNSQESLAHELDRLQNQLATVDTPDPIDVAVVEALKSKEVQELLLAILDAGAVLKGCEMQPAGSIAGIVQLTFLTAWLPDTSHLTQSPVVSAIMEISPPRIIKAVQHLSTTQPTVSSFAAPAGPAPVALQDLGIPSATQAYFFHLEANRSFQEWLNQQGYGSRITEIRAIAGFTTGTKCTSLLCFEHTSDDADVQ